MAKARHSALSPTFNENESPLYRLFSRKDSHGRPMISEFQFAAGERQVTVYAGFCPPFELLPEVEVNVADDFEAEVKLAQVLHNGAQIDVRLSEPAEEPVTVTIEFVAAGM